MKEVEKILNRFNTNVIGKAKGNLTRKKKNASKQLYDSFKSGVKTSPNGFISTITAEDYWEYQDQGVSGIEKKFNTPFSYKEKQAGTLKGMPPASAFDRWNIMKGRALRSTLGTFLPRKALNFATAVSVFKYGIEPTGFFRNPFKEAFRNLPKEIAEAFLLDVRFSLNQALKK